MPMTWELTAVDTQTRNVRHREYTNSSVRAQAWNRIPRIQFSDSYHGIIFVTARHHARKRLPYITALQDHVSKHLPELQADIRKQHIHMMREAFMRNRAMPAPRPVPSCEIGMPAEGPMFPKGRDE